MSGDDYALLTRIKFALAADERTGLIDVDVDVVDGTVFLRGRVQAEADRVAAVAVSAGIAGVRRVCCELHVLRTKQATHERLLPRGRPWFAGEGETFLR